MGMDGAGKTTIIQHLEGWFKELGVRTHMEHTHDYQVRAIHGLVQSFGQEDRIRRFHYFLYGWPLVAMLDHWITFRRRFAAHDPKMLILTDRYFYDKYVRFRFWGIALPGLFYLYRWLIPHPTCTILLDVPTEIAVKRKGEYSSRDYDTFRREYLSFAKKMGRFVRVVDAARPLNVVLEDVQKEISAACRDQRLIPA